MSIAEMILAFFFPPIYMLVKFGPGKKFWLNFVLTLIGWFPGMIHAFIVGKKGTEVANVSNA
jgi:uncharacterized membrane protein YqaE (UPF0057 family)